MWDDKGSHELIHACDVVESLKAKPKGLCSRFAVTLATQKATEFGRQAHGYPSQQQWTAELSYPRCMLLL